MSKRPIVTAPRRARREALRREIEATRDSKGRLTTQRVVEAAKDPKSVLHSQFEWDDSVAAHQHRLGVARALIRDIVYIGVDSTGKAVSAIAYVPEPGVYNRSSFIPLSSAVRNKTLAVEIMTAELARCEGNIRRTQDIADVLKMRAHIDKLLHDLIGIQEKVKRASMRIKTSKRTQREDRPAA